MKQFKAILCILVVVLVFEPSLEITLNQPRTQKLYSPTENWMSLSLDLPLDRRSGVYQEYKENLYFLARKSSGSNLYQFWKKDMGAKTEELLLNNIDLTDFTPAGFSLNITDMENPQLLYIVGSTENNKVHFMRVLETETPEEYIYYKTTHILGDSFDPSDVYVTDDQRMDGSIFVGINFYYQSSFPWPFEEEYSRHSQENSDAGARLLQTEEEESEEEATSEEEEEPETLMLFSHFKLLKFHKLYNLTEWVVSPLMTDYAEEHLEIQEILPIPSLGIVHILGNTNIQELGNIHPYNQNAKPLEVDNLNAFIMTYSYDNGILEWARVIGYPDNDVYVCATTYDGELFVVVNGPTQKWADGSMANDLIYRRFSSEDGREVAEVIFGNTNSLETRGVDILVNHQGIFILLEFQPGLRPHPDDQEAFDTLKSTEENIGIAWVSWLNKILDLEAWDVYDPKMRTVDRLFAVETWDLRHNFVFLSQFESQGVFTQTLPKISFDENDVNCHESCYRCNAFDELSCTVCYPGDTLYKNRCYSTCPKNLENTFSTYRVGSKVEEYEEDYGYCRNCHFSCATCDGYEEYSRDSCDYCRESTGFIFKNGMCVCESGKVESRGSCQSNCDNDVPFLERITRKDYTVGAKINTVPYHLCTISCPENTLKEMLNGEDDVSVYDSRRTEYDPDLDCVTDSVAMAFAYNTGPLVLPAPENLEFEDEFSFSFWLYPAGDLVTVQEYQEYRPFSFSRNTQLMMAFDIVTVTLDPRPNSEVDFDMVFSVHQESGDVTSMQYPFECEAHQWCYISGGIYTEYFSEEEQPEFWGYFQAHEWEADEEQVKMDPGNLNRVSFVEASDSYGYWDAYEPYVVLGGAVNKNFEPVTDTSFNGYIQNLRIYSKFYSAYYMEENAFRDDYEFSRADDSLIAWWRFNETVGSGFVEDRSSFNLEETFSGDFPSLETLTLGDEVLPFYELGYKMEYCQSRDVTDCVYFDDYFTKLPTIVPDAIMLQYEEESVREYDEMFVHFADVDQLEDLMYEVVVFEEYDEFGLYQGRCQTDLMVTYYAYNEYGEYELMSPTLNRFDQVDPGHYEVCFLDYETEELILFSQLYIAMPPQGVFPANSASIFEEDNFVDFTTFGDGVMADNDVIIFYNDCEELQDELNNWNGYGSSELELKDVFVNYAHIRRRDLDWSSLHSFLVDKSYDQAKFMSFGMNSMCLLSSYNFYSTEYYMLENLPNALWSIQHQPYAYGLGSTTNSLPDADNPWEVGVECNYGINADVDVPMPELTTGLQWWDLVIYDGPDLDKRGGFFTGDKIIFVECSFDEGILTSDACVSSWVLSNKLGEIEFAYNEWPMIWFGQTRGVKIKPQDSTQEFIDVCLCYNPKDTGYNSFTNDYIYMPIHAPMASDDSTKSDCWLRANTNSDFLEVVEIFPPSKNYGIYTDEAPYVKVDYKVYQTKPKDGSFQTYINVYLIRYKITSATDYNMWLYPYFDLLNSDSTLNEHAPITCQENELTYKEDYVNPSSIFRTSINGEIIFENADQWEKKPEIGAHYMIDISLSAIKTPDDGVRSGQYLFGGKGSRDMSEYVYGNKFIVQYIDYKIFPALYKKHPSDTMIQFKGENMSSVTTSWNWTVGPNTADASPRQMDWLTEIFRVKVFVSSSEDCNDDLLPKSADSLRGIVNTYSNTDATISHLKLDHLEEGDILCGNFSIKRISTYAYSEENPSPPNEFFERWEFRDSILLGYIGCDSSCKTCNGTGSNYCIHCNDGEYFQEGTCVSSCTGGRVLVQENLYASFPDSAIDDLKETYGDLEEFPQWVCVDSCPDSTYPDPETSICISCNSNCKSCSGVEATSCLSCYLGFYLYQGFCLTTCPMGFHSLDGETCVEDDDLVTESPLLTVSIIDQNWLNKLHVDRDYYAMAKVLYESEEMDISASFIEWRIEDSLGIFTNDMFNGERFNTTVVFLDSSRFPDISYDHAFTLVLNVEFGGEVATDSYIFELYQATEGGDLSCSTSTITPLTSVYVSASSIPVGDAPYAYKLFYQIEGQEEMVMLKDTWKDETLSRDFTIPSFTMPIVELEETVAIRFVLEVTDEFNGIFYVNTDNRNPNLVVNAFGSIQSTISAAITYLEGIDLEGITDATLLNEFAINLYAVAKSYPKLSTSDKICTTNKGCLYGECQEKRSVSYCLCDLGYTGKNCQYPTEQADSLVTLTAKAFDGVELLYSGQTISSVDSIELVSRLLAQLTYDPAFLEGGDTIVTLTLELMSAINEALPETWIQVDQETLDTIMEVYSNIADYCMDYYKALATGSLLDDLDAEGTDLETEYNLYVEALAVQTETILKVVYDQANYFCEMLLWTLSTGGPTRDIESTFITARMGALKPDDIIDSVLSLPNVETGVIYIPVGIFTGKSSFFFKQNDVRYKLLKWNASPFSFDDTTRERVYTDIVSVELFEGQTETKIDLENLVHPLEIFIPVKNVGPSGYNSKFLKCLWWAWDYELPSTLENVTYAVDDEFFEGMTIDEINEKYSLNLTSTSTEATLELEIPGEIIDGYIADGCGVVYTGTDYIICRCDHATEFAGVFTEVDSMDISVVTGGISTEFDALENWKQTIGFYSVVTLSSIFLFSVLIGMVVEMRFLEKKREELINAKKPEYIKNLEQEEKEREERLNKGKKKKSDHKKKSAEQRIKESHDKKMQELSGKLKTPSNPDEQAKDDNDLKANPTGNAIMSFNPGLGALPNQQGNHLLNMKNLEIHNHGNNVGFHNYMMSQMLGVDPKILAEMKPDFVNQLGPKSAFQGNEMSISNHPDAQGGALVPVGAMSSYAGKSGAKNLDESGEGLLTDDEIEHKKVQEEKEKQKEKYLNMKMFKKDQAFAQKIATFNKCSLVQLFLWTHPILNIPVLTSLTLPRHPRIAMMFMYMYSHMFVNSMVIFFFRNPYQKPDESRAFQSMEVGDFLLSLLSIVVSTILVYIYYTIFKTSDLRIRMARTYPQLHKMM